MDNIRNELQTWLELVARIVKNIPFDVEVTWNDIEDVYNGTHAKETTPMFTAHSESLTFEIVYCDSVCIDHMASEILIGDFEDAMRLIKRYRGIVLSDSLASERINQNSVSS